MKTKTKNKENRTPEEAVPLIKNSYFTHLINHQKIYLLLLLVLVLGSTVLSNAQAQKPFLSGSESYYHLTQAREVTWRTFYYYPLRWLEQAGGLPALMVLPLLLAASSLAILWRIMKRMGISPVAMLIFSSFFILSPTFMIAFTTLSHAALFFFLFLCGTDLLLQRQKNAQYWAILPVGAIAFIDQFSAILTALIFAIFRFTQDQKRSHLFPWTIAVLGLTSLVAAVVFKVTFVQGPFNEQHLAADLLSDLGGRGGISFFIFVMAMIGLVLLWKKRSVLTLSYLALPFLIPAYIYNTEAAFPLHFVLIIFATLCFLNLLEWHWHLPTLQRFTLLLLILGILFSTTAVMSRAGTMSPTLEEVSTFVWMRENLPANAIIVASPEEADYLHYFAQRQVFYSFREEDQPRTDDQNRIFAAVYVHELFPVLERNGITHLYLSATTKKKLSPDQGLLFLLQNERFKLAYSAGDTEVWEFREPRKNG